MKTVIDMSQMHYTTRESVAVFSSFDFVHLPPPLNCISFCFILREIEDYKANSVIFVWQVDGGMHVASRSAG